MKGVHVQYETPEMLELGPVEDLTFGGELWPSIDRLTGYRGFGGVTASEQDQEE
jgi:hypothetical protein